MFIVLFIVLSLSSAAGIGGGGLIIPLMMVIAEFPQYASIPLSVTSIAGSSSVRFLLQVELFASHFSRSDTIGAEEASGGSQAAFD